MAAKKLGWVDRVIRLLNWAAAAAMALAVVGYYVDPRTTSLLALLGLGYPVLLAVNLLFVIYWGFKARRQVWISLLALVISWGQLSTFYRFRSGKQMVPAGPQLRVMSFNVRMFNRYNWIDQPGIAAEIKKTIESQTPDLLFIQEYYTYEETPKFSFPHSYIQVTNEGKNYGLAIFSQYPIIRTGRVPYHSPGESQNDEFIYADLLIGRDTVRAVNTHLASLRLDYRDYALLEHPNQEEQEVKRGLFQILGRIQAAFRRRAHQVDALLKFLEKNRLPVILAGDLNDTPSSRAYHRITDHLKDAYTEAGSGFSATYVRSPIPLRIDHLFLSPGFMITDHRVIKDGPWSDHYPVVVTCGLD